MLAQKRKAAATEDGLITAVQEMSSELDTGKQAEITPASVAPEIGVALLGMGVVGTGVARVLSEKQEWLQSMCGCRISLKGVLVRDTARPRLCNVPADLLTSDFDSIVNNPEVDIVVEVMGGQRPALDHIRQSILQGKHVVTANKEVMARHGWEILTLAADKGVQVLFEASVGAGTPIVRPLVRDLAANEISSIRGIINGTTNYILKKMADEGLDYGVALAEAQELGYAEPDPTNDVEGIDAAYKLAILSTLAFHTRVRDSDVYHEGITRLNAQDFVYARELGYTIKLMAIAKKSGGGLQARVHPTFVPERVLIAKVDGVLNAVEIETDLAGPVFFHGRGAGSLPTSSAVVADIVEAARSIAANVKPSTSLRLHENIRIAPMQELETRYYLRLNVVDRPGVMGQISKVLGDCGISISSIIQKTSDQVSQRAEVVIMTHRAREASVQAALQELEHLEVVHQIGNLVRVEEWDI